MLAKYQSLSRASDLRFTTRARRHHEVFKMKLGFVRIGDCLKQRGNDVMEVRLQKRIEIVLAITAATDQTSNSQQRQMVTDCRLTLLQTLAESRDMQFAFTIQVHQHAQTSFVRQQFEDLNQITLQLIWELGVGLSFFSADGGLNKFEHVFLCLLR